MKRKKRKKYYEGDRLKFLKIIFTCTNCLINRQIKTIYTLNTNQFTNANRAILLAWNTLKGIT
jgi:hypothetical protein